jgi:hypothetical protein
LDAAKGMLKEGVSMDTVIRGLKLSKKQIQSLTKGN